MPQIINRPRYLRDHRAVGAGGVHAVLRRPPAAFGRTATVRSQTDSCARVLVFAVASLLAATADGGGRPRLQPVRCRGGRRRDLPREPVPHQRGLHGRHGRWHSRSGARQIGGMAALARSSAGCSPRTCHGVGPSVSTSDLRHRCRRRAAARPESRDPAVTSGHDLSVSSLGAHVGLLVLALIEGRTYAGGRRSSSWSSAVCPWQRRCVVAGNPWRRCSRSCVRGLLAWERRLATHGRTALVDYPLLNHLVRPRQRCRGVVALGEFGVLFTLPFGCRTSKAAAPPQPG